MTKAETAKIMATLWAAYPGFYSKAGNGDQAAAVELWQKCFEAEPYELVSAAVYALIKVRPNSYPPAIGEVTAQIQRLVRPDELTAMEAWNLVAKALRNSAYGSEEQSVVASNFQRAFTARQKSEREFEALPPAVRQYVAALTEGESVLKRLEG